MSEVNTVAVVLAAAPALPHWLEFLQAAVPIVAAIIAAYVTWRVGKTQGEISAQQAETAQSALKLELFEKRLKVHDALMYVVNSANANAVLPNNYEQEFLEGVKGAKWLFDSEVEEFIDEFWILAHRFKQATEDWKFAENTPQRGEMAAKKNNLLKKLSEQQKIIDDLFAKYLRFKN